MGRSWQEKWCTQSPEDDIPRPMVGKGRGGGGRSGARPCFPALDVEKIKHSPKRQPPAKDHKVMHPKLRVVPASRRTQGGERTESEVVTPRRLSHHLLRRWLAPTLPLPSLGLPPLARCGQQSRATGSCTSSRCSHTSPRGRGEEAPVQDPTLQFV